LLRLNFSASDAPPSGTCCPSSSPATSA
jgi:hypothetical protein